MRPEYDTDHFTVLFHYYSKQDEAEDKDFKFNFWAHLFSAYFETAYNFKATFQDRIKPQQKVKVSN